MLERSSTSEIPGFGILHPDIPSMQGISTDAECNP